MRSSPSSRFSSVDFPAFGRPTMASFSGRPASSSSGSASASGSRSAISAISSEIPSPCSADTATGSPSPSSNASSTEDRDDRPSALFATSSTGRPCRRSHWAKCRSAGVTPARASTTNTVRSAVAVATPAPSRIRPAMVSGAASSSPAVSTSRTRRPRSSASASLRSRVTPGVSATSASRRPASRLNSVLLPTFGRPAITTSGSIAAIQRSASSLPSSVTTKTVPSATTGPSEAAPDSSCWPRISPV